MAKYIEQEAAIESVQEKLRICEALPNDITKAAGILTLKSIQDSLESIPAADVRPVVRGKWEQTKDEFGIYNKCSVCRKEYYCGPIAPFNFCPNCGADMREEAMQDARDGP